MVAQTVERVNTSRLEAAWDSRDVCIREIRRAESRGDREAVNAWRESRAQVEAEILRLTGGRGW